MPDKNESGNTALALAIYASTAATTCAIALRNAGLIDQANIDQLVTHLTRCRAIAGDEPAMIEHAELLTDLLLSAAPKSPQD